MFDEKHLSRRRFLELNAAAAALAMAPQAFGRQGRRGHVIISTWPFGVAANKEALKILSSGGSALDAAVGGVQVVELDPNIQSVGLGGRPNADGIVQLDACVMDGGTANAGAVAALEDVATAAAVARRVMEKTRHILLVGEGARRFALSQGFKKQNLLTPESKALWEQWRASKGRPRKPPHLEEDHDTIGLLALHQNGTLAGACTTSGLAWKRAGRVGDSPLIGHGLFVDDDAGAAAATGVGEEVIRIAGSHTVVEMMRQGRSPQEACEAACKRIIDTNRRKRKRLDVPPVAFIALSPKGKVGACSIHRGYHRYALTVRGETKLLVAKGILPGLQK